MGMVNVQSRQRRAGRASLLVSLFLVAGCSGGGSTTVPPSTTPVVEFQLPSEGATLISPFVISVSASGASLDRVTFEVDGRVESDDAAAPYEWNLSPQSYATGSHQIRVGAHWSDGVEWRSVAVTFAAAPSGTSQPPEVYEAVANLLPGQWYEVPNTRVEDLAPSPPPEGEIDGIFKGWGGAAYDTARDRLYVWGGGHANYAGNEVYGFDMKELYWSRLTDPSPYPASGVLHADGAPMARHTYDTLAYLPTIDRMIVPGGGGYWGLLNYGAPVSDVNKVFLFDGGSSTWSSSGVTEAGGLMSATAVDGDGDLWIVQGNTSAGGLWHFEPATATWTRHTYHQLWTSVTGEIDPVRRVLVYVGNGVARRFWLDSSALDPSDPWNDKSEAVSLAGAGSVATGIAPGLAYHPASGKLFAWSGGRNVYSLDTATWTWTEHQGTGADPGAPAQNGTFARWAWCATRNVFVVANAAHRNVFVYRPPS